METQKLGLCVRYDCNNYGSMLQILATQKIIERLGWKYEIVKYDKKTVSFLIKNIFRVFNPYFMRGKKMELEKKRKLQKHPDIRQKNSERLAMFRKYRDTYIGPYSPIIKGYSNLVKYTENYSAFMVGSDQLWTPAGIKSRFYNLIFVPNHIKKISFATSFGVSEIPDNQVKMTKFYLDRIEHLSVREAAGAKIIEQLTGKKAQVALDPTMMLTGEEWETMFPTPKSEGVPYIFAYFLGTNPQHRLAVNELSSNTGLKIITCPHLDEFVEADEEFGHEQNYNVGPVDFLNLIRKATYICTDSFHGTVFSILNHKQFITFERFGSGEKQSRNSRIDNLFHLLGLEERRFRGEIVESIKKKIEYSEVDQKLNAQRLVTYCFLDSALNGENDD